MNESTAASMHDCVFCGAKADCYVHGVGFVCEACLKRDNTWQDVYEFER